MEKTHKIRLNKKSTLKMLHISSLQKLALITFFSVFAFGCQAPQTANENSSNESNKSKKADVTPTPKEDINEFDRELKSMRVADFDYIFTLKRKDSGKFVSEDKKFVRENIHYATNRTSFVEDEKILFLGSNYKFTDENIKALKERFEFQDFSKSEEQIEKEREAKRKEREAKNANAENNNSAENSNTKEQN